MSAPAPIPADRIFTVPSTRPFLASVARALLDGHLPRAGGPRPRVEELADMTVLLPTRRSIKALQEALLDAVAGRALVLPRIRPIGVADEDQVLIEAAAAPAPSEGLAVVPAVPELERRLVLARLVLAWSAASRGAADSAGLRTDAETREPLVRAVTPAQALLLARELAGLLDMVEIEQRSLAPLASLVPEGLAGHWQETVGFLSILTEAWPAYLAERGLASVVGRRNRMLAAEAERLAARPPPGPVIIAGVTGSVPATAELMRTVGTLAQGAIVLPALDLALDQASFAAIRPDHPGHPQFGLAKLLAEFGVARASVGWLPGAEPDPDDEARLAFVSEALRPAATTALWRAFADGADRPRLARALSGLSLIEAPGPEAEAASIALVLRQAVETPGRTAALVTPDRVLGRRVSAELERWGLRVDDSAGRPLPKTVPGSFLDLILGALESGFAPVAVMALLKHPLTRLGREVRAARQAARALELAAFRRPYIGTGLDGIDASLARAEAETGRDGERHPVLRRLRAADWAAARLLLEHLRTALAPLSRLFDAGRPASLASLALAHAEAAERIALRPGAEGAHGAHLWQGEAGELAAGLFARVADSSLPRLELDPGQYPDLYRGLAGEIAVRLSVSLHPRLFIWGPLEARLMRPDVVVLGGLNEGTWPAAADPGPWLSRPMRAALGLPAPEERSGQSAHDFACLLGARTVVLTRSAKVDGNPTVASRWLLRLQALLGGLGLGEALAGDARTPWLAWATAKSDAPPRRPARPPEPRPALGLRPRRLSVSDVETWIANPYALYARRILRLEPLPALAAEPDAATRGTLIHRALHRFAAAHPRALPPDSAAVLVDLLDEALREHRAHPRIAAFWRPRFQRFAEWFAATEPQRRSGARATLAEVAGRHALAAPAGPFELTARADRIDVLEHGLVITDYKSGSAPTNSQVAAGFRPQLPLEALIAAHGGFAGVAAGPAMALRYIEAKGGEPPGLEREVSGDIAAMAEAARAGVTRLVTLFDDARTPYRPLRRPGLTYAFDGFAHLARVAEWSGGGGGDE